jgi:hypothetical protein
MSLSIFSSFMGLMGAVFVLPAAWTWLGAGANLQSKFAYHGISSDVEVRF